MASIKTSPVASDARIAAITGTTAWAAASVSYGFPTGSSSYAAGYTNPAAKSFSAISSTQKAAVARALDDDSSLVPAAARGFTVEGFTNLELKLGSGSADIRYGNASSRTVPTAYAYVPGTTAEGGDVWFGGAGRAPAVGNYDYLAVLHETGHALGLKHPHEKAGSHGALSLAWDGIEYTVMSYRSHLGGSLGLYGETWGAPQTYMMLDIAGLQSLYGADYKTNAGNSVYKWTPGSGDTLIDGKVAIDASANRIFMTVWDGGGKDTYDLSTYETALSIDLSPGGFSRFSKEQTAEVDWRSDTLAKGNVYNALLYKGDLRSLIENALGGAGNDRITGNVAANTLTGNAGNDLLSGSTGNDVLRGGDGADRLYGQGDNDVLSGGTGNDLLVGGGGIDRLAGEAGIDTLQGGAGNDVFVFASAGHSVHGAADRILASDGVAAFEGIGAAAGDRIDLSRIDANTGSAGNQAFRFAAGYSEAWLKQAGHLWAVESGTNTVIRGTVDAKAGIDFEIIVADGSIRNTSWTAADFIL